MDGPSAAIAARMEAVLAQRGWSAREWSRRAGLDESRVTLLLDALRCSQGDHFALHDGWRPAVETCRALASSAGVTVEWLVYGSVAKAAESTALRVVATCRDAACIDFAAPFDGYVMATVWRPTATGYDVQEETLEVFQ